MREIKFRGKRLDNGEWVYGNLIIDNGRQNEFKYRIQPFDGICFAYPVDPGTVGQYTGLHDKKGREIYEGDICLDSLGWVFEVRWDNDNGRFLGYHSKPRGDTYVCYVGREPKSVVIGNIYENPELLKEGD